MGRKRLADVSEATNKQRELLGEMVMGCLAEERGALTDGEVTDLAKALKTSASFKHAVIDALRGAEEFRRWPMRPATP